MKLLSNIKLALSIFGTYYTIKGYSASEIFSNNKVAYIMLDDNLSYCFGEPSDNFFINTLGNKVFSNALSVAFNDSST